MHGGPSCTAEGHPMEGARETKWTGRWIGSVDMSQMYSITPCVRSSTTIQALMIIQRLWYGPSFIFVAVLFIIVALAR